VLLRVGDTILSKRKRDFEVNKSLKEKVEKVRQEEEDRLRATVTNDAARSALGMLFSNTFLSTTLLALPNCTPSSGQHLKCRF
jgi:hypothetical protein